VVDEIYPARMRAVGLVEQLQADRGAAETTNLTAAARQPLVAQQGSLIKGELETNGIGRDDRCEQGGVAAGAARHQVALCHAAVTDATRDWRPQLGVFEIELSLPHHSLVSRHRGLGVAEGSGALLV